MLKLYFFGLVLATAVSVSCLGAILFYIDPFSADWMVMSLFYFLLAMGVAGTVTIVGWLVRRVSRRKVNTQISFQILEISFRQALLISLSFISVLVLQSQRALQWWHFLVLMAVVGAVEWWFLSKTN